MRFSTDDGDVMQDLADELGWERKEFEQELERLRGGKKRVTIYNLEDDWSGVYVNGKLAGEGHTNMIKSYVLEYVLEEHGIVPKDTIAFPHADGTEIDTFVTDKGGFPKDESGLPKPKARKAKKR